MNLSLRDLSPEFASRATPIAAPLVGHVHQERRPSSRPTRRHPPAPVGLAEKINFEVTLLKAVEASRARAIDSLIKELAALADEAPAETGGSEKKKR